LACDATPNASAEASAMPAACFTMLDMRNLPSWQPP
jgi:hypothetical protein